MKRIAVLVSGGGTNLQALLNAEQSGVIKSGKIVAVVASKPGVYALERAKKAGVASTVISRKEFDSADAFNHALCAYMQSMQIDLIVLAGYLSIVSGELLSAYQNRIINIHPSLIPSFCGKGFYGLRVHQAALDYGVKVTGATVHFVNAIPDGGRIIAQKAVDILPGDTPETLQRRVMEQAEWKLLPAAAEQVARELVEKGKTTWNDRT